MPAFSIIIPADNAQTTILETIRSVQKQTFSDWEIVLINDGSTDGTLNILNQIEDERLRVFSYENAGAYVARNRGIAHATGEIIAFLNADVLWTPDHLEQQFAALQPHPKAEVVYSWPSFIDEQGKFLWLQPAVYFEGRVYSQLLVRNFSACGSVLLVRKQAVESVGDVPDLAASEEQEYLLRWARQWTFVLVPRDQVLECPSGSISSQVEQREKWKIATIEKEFQNAPAELQGLKNQSLANEYRFLARLYLRQADHSGVKQAAQTLHQAVRLSPKLLMKRETQTLLGKCLIMQTIRTARTVRASNQKRVDSLLQKNYQNVWVKLKQALAKE